MIETVKTRWLGYVPDLCVFAFAAASFAARRWTPAAPWGFGVGFCAVYVAARTAGLPRRELAWAAGCCAAALLVQGLSLAVLGYHNPLLDPDPHDDLQYLVRGRAIAEAWQSGFYPELSLRGSLPYLGTLHTGYERALATVFLIAPRAPASG